MSPAYKARELFNSKQLRPLASYLDQWKAGTITVPTEYVLEVCAAYFRLMVDKQP